MPAKIAYHDTALDKAIDDCSARRPHLIEGLLYERSSVMISAEPGIGKSVISLCATAQVSCGQSVFGWLRVPRPLKVYYIITERGAQEHLERLKLMRQEIKLNSSNIWLDDTIIGIDMVRQDHADMLLHRIAISCPDGVDIVIFDPIYATVRGGLSDEIPAKAICLMSERLQQSFGCSVWFNNHTTKLTYTNNGKPVQKDDPFYGSVWLKAHCAGAFLVKRTENGVSLTCKKDTYSMLESYMELNFDMETFTLDYVTRDDKLSTLDKTRVFLKRCKEESKQFSFQDYAVHIGVCTRLLRTTLNSTPVSGCLLKHKSPGKKTLYEVVSDVL